MSCNAKEVVVSCNAKEGVAAKSVVVVRVAVVTQESVMTPLSLRPLELAQLEPWPALKSRVGKGRKGPTTKKG